MGNLYEVEHMRRNMTGGGRSIRRRVTLRWPSGGHCRGGQEGIVDIRPKHREGTLPASTAVAPGGPAERHPMASERHRRKEKGRVFLLVFY